MGLTSSDVWDTATALQLRDAADLLIAGQERLRGVLGALAVRHKDTVMIGRTHGVHAEPITFGLKVAVWYAEAGRNLERLRRAREVIAVGKISGAVGSFAHVDPEIEEEVCRDLGLAAAPASTQVIQRDRHAEYCTTLAIAAASLEKIALEVRGLQRTETLEAGGAVRRGPEGLERHAPQAQPRAGRADLRSGAARAHQRPGRPGERRPLARARHQPLLGGAGHLAGLDDPARLRAGPDASPFWRACTSIPRG